MFLLNSCSRIEILRQYFSVSMTFFWSPLFVCVWHLKYKWVYWLISAPLEWSLSVSFKHRILKIGSREKNYSLPREKEIFRDFDKYPIFWKIKKLEYRISDILKKSKISNLEYRIFWKRQNIESRISDIRDFEKSRRFLKSRAHPWSEFYFVAAKL